MPLPDASHVARCALTRLAAEDTAEIVSWHLGSSAARPGLVARIVERSDGVPLLAEELSKAMLGAAADGSVEEPIPATLHGFLTARLDRLPAAAKWAAQIGAAIGREILPGPVAGVRRPAGKRRPCIG